MNAQVMRDDPENERDVQIGEERTKDVMEDADEVAMERK